MAALSLTYTITNGTTEDATQVQQNFTDILNYCNNSVMRIDGTNSMTAQLLTNNIDPTAASGAVRKAYLDGPIVNAHNGVAQAFTNNVYKTVLFLTEDRDTDNGIAAANYNLATGVFTCPKTGLYLLSADLFNGSGADTQRWDARFHILGGTAIDITGPQIIPADFSGGAFGVDVHIHFTTAWLLTVGQTVEPQIRMNANQTKSAGGWLSICWLHG